MITRKNEVIFIWGGGEGERRKEDSPQMHLCGSGFRRDKKLPKIGKKSPTLNISSKKLLSNRLKQEANLILRILPFRLIFNFFYLIRIMGCLLDLDILINIVSKCGSRIRIHTKNMRIHTTAQKSRFPQIGTGRG